MGMERIVLAMMCGRNHTEVFVVNKPAFRFKEVLIHFLLSMLGVCRRMYSKLASLKIPQISQRMTLNYLPVMESGRFSCIC